MDVIVTVMNDSDRRFVCAIARRIVGDQDAGDVAQETLLLAHRNRDRFRGDASYRTWLYRIATTAALTHLRSQRRRRLDRTVSIDDAGPLPADDRQRATPEDELVRAEQAAQVRAGVAALTPAYRDVLQLRFMQDLSEVEVADALAISVANVKVRAHRARHALRGALTPADRLADPAAPAPARTARSSETAAAIAPARRLARRAAPPARTATATRSAA